MEGISLGLQMFRWLTSFAPRMKITNHEQVLPGALLTFLGIGLPRAKIAIDSVPVVGHGRCLREKKIRKHGETPPEARPGHFTQVFRCLDTRGPGPDVRRPGEHRQHRDQPGARDDQAAEHRLSA